MSRSLAFVGAIAASLTACNSQPTVEVLSQGGVDLCYSTEAGARLPPVTISAASSPDGLAVTLSNVPNLSKPAVFEVRREGRVLRLIGMRPPGAELAVVCTRMYQLMVRGLPTGTYDVRAEVTIQGGTEVKAGATIEHR